MVRLSRIHLSKEGWSGQALRRAEGRLIPAGSGASDGCPRLKIPVLRCIAIQDWPAGRRFWFAWCTLGSESGRSWETAVPLPGASRFLRPWRKAHREGHRLSPRWYASGEECHSPRPPHTHTWQRSGFCSLFCILLSHYLRIGPSK